MAFSGRTRFDLRPNRLSQSLAEARAAGRVLLDLTASNPTGIGLRYPDALRTALADERVLRYEPDARGLRVARDAVRRHLRAGGLDVADDRILLTASTSEAYSYLFKLLCDPDDAVLVPAPGYPLLEHLAKLERVALRRYRLVYDGRWHVDFESLEAALDARARALVVVHPHNPTGSFVSAADLARLESIAADHGLAIVSDEVFAEYGWRAASGAEPRAPSAATCARALSFALGGLSKSVGLPQMKLGWVVAGGPDEAMSEAMARLEVVADAFLSVGTPVQCAAPALLRHGARVRASIRRRAERNRRAAAGALSGETRCSMLAAEGGWYAVLRVPATRSDDEWAIELLERDGVVVQPGWFFDFERDGYLVLSLLPEPSIFDEGVRRLLARIDTDG